MTRPGPRSAVLSVHQFIQPLTARASLAMYNTREDVDALLAAKAQGKVRCIGFTGHKDPAIHLRMLSYDYPFDAVQMRSRPAEYFP